MTISSSSISHKFLGRWQLISCEGSSGQKKSFPLGEKPSGAIIYTPTYVMVFIAATDRVRFGTNDIRAIAPEEVMGDFPKFETYYGRFAIDAEAGVVSHFIENGKIPNQIGETFSRRFSFHEDKLVLETTDGLLLNGEPWFFKLVWTKQENF